MNLKEKILPDQIRKKGIQLQFTNKFSTFFVFIFNVFLRIQLVDLRSH